MKGYSVLYIFAIALAVFIGITLTIQSQPKPKSTLVVQTDNVPIQYVGTIKVAHSDSMRVRLLVLKHCKESMADGDANLAIKAANLAASKGLDISEIGNHYINKDGQWRWSQQVKLDRLKDFISEQMKVNAQPGDTLVVFTIGHGFRSGGLQFLGQRREVMTAIAEAAQENGQETLWWQLSCYASASLPDINELNQEQQELLSIVASSDDSHTSAAYVQGRHMEKLFVAMAEQPRSVDKDGDEIITAKELADFLNQAIGNSRGRLVYAKSPNEPIFGLLGGFANSIPIRNHEGPPFQWPDRYIPLPRR